MPEPDRIRPAPVINKEFDVRFVLGYTTLDFRDTLYRLADGWLFAGHRGGCYVAVHPRVTSAARKSCH